MTETGNRVRLARSIYQMFEGNFVMTLTTTVHVVLNPYGETIAGTEFEALLERVAVARADDIEQRHRSGEYERDRMAFALLDPTAAPSVAADDIVLATVLIGEEADFFAPNALAKAFCLRDHGADGMVVIASENHRAADGSFRFGGAVDIAGTVVGGSGQTPLQDRHQSTLFAADFNYQVATAREAWEQEHGWGRWYLNEQAVDRRIQSVMNRITPGVSVPT